MAGAVAARHERREYWRNQREHRGRTRSSGAHRNKGKRGGADKSGPKEAAQGFKAKGVKAGAGKSTKIASMIVLLCRINGVSLDELCKRTGWQRARNFPVSSLPSGARRLNMASVSRHFRREMWREEVCRNPTGTARSLRKHCSVLSGSEQSMLRRNMSRTPPIEAMLTMWPWPRASHSLARQLRRGRHYRILYVTCRKAERPIPSYQLVL